MYPQRVTVEGLMDTGLPEEEAVEIFDMMRRLDDETTIRDRMAKAGLREGRYGGGYILDIQDELIRYIHKVFERCGLTSNSDVVTYGIGDRDVWAAFVVPVHRMDPTVFLLDHKSEPWLNQFYISTMEDMLY